MASLPITLPAPFHSENYPSGSQSIDDADFWTFDAVEDRFIEAMRFAWRDAPGHWPYAGDGPWHLMQAVAGDYDARGGDMEAPPPVRVPLSRAERARMDETVGWLALVPEPARPGARIGTGSDAKLIVLVARKLGAKRGEERGQVPWTKLLRPMGMERGGRALAWRYGKAISAIAVELERRGTAVNLARDCPTR